MSLSHMFMNHYYLLCHMSLSHLFLVHYNFRSHIALSQLFTNALLFVVSQELDGQLDSSDEELLNLLQEDAEHEKQVMETIFFFGMYHDTYMHKNKRRTAL
jgi:hypothetical protein